MAEPYAPQSPLWWVSRQWKRLQARIAIIDVFDAYYRGEPRRYPWLPEQAREEFTRLLALTKSNYMGLVADALAERCSADGFRIGDEPKADKDVARMWEANGLYGDIDKAILESIVSGGSYMLVEPNLADPTNPNIFVEHPSQATVEYVPGSGGRRRAAGLKLWLDDWTGDQMSTLFLPGSRPGDPPLFVYKFRAPKHHSYAGSEPRWEPRRVAGEDWPVKSDLSAVPLVEIPNNPRMVVDSETGLMGVSELTDVIGIQDRIAKTLADRLMTQDFGAFPQKWATGWPEADEQGNKNPKIDVGRNRMVTTDAVDAKMGQWESAPMDPYSAAKREDVKDIASRTRTPAQYLLGELSNVNGETLKAAESGLVSKARQRMRGYGQGLRSVVTLAREAAGLPEAEAIEVIWRNPEFRTEGELVDALTKMKTLNVPDEALWERWGATPPEIERWKKMAEEQQRLNPALQVAAALGGTPPAGPGESD